MFDVKKLVEGILAFVNFFAVRIAVVGFVAGLIYKISGRYYFDIAMTFIGGSPISGEGLKSYIAKASEYVTEANVKNAIFVVTLIICLSLLDILYRFIGRLGGLLPVSMQYEYRYSTNRFQPLILETWRRYARQYDPLAFYQLVEEKAGAELWKARTDRWWNTLFRYSKSFIVATFILYVLTPRAALKVSLLDVLVYVTLAVICMVVCAAIESARVANDMSSALRRTLNVLDDEAKDAPISDDEYKKARKNIYSPLRPPKLVDWRGRFSTVKLTIGIPYIVSASDLLAYRRAMAQKLKRLL